MVIHSWSFLDKLMKPLPIGALRDPPPSEEAEGGVKLPVHGLRRMLTWKSNTPRIRPPMLY